MKILTLVGCLKLAGYMVLAGVCLGIFAIFVAFPSERALLTGQFGPVAAGIFWGCCAFISIYLLISFAIDWARPRESRDGDPNA